jgi:3-isopropylmalate/(R)-2-methylmalate dehydratase small subunit
MKLKNLRGRVAYVFAEDDFDVDQIVGVKNIRIQDVEELKRVAMQSFDPGFATSVRAGDLLVGGANFGYGHPHYPPMTAMRAFGVTCVIAESFSPGYWWGEMAEGFPQIACPGILGLVRRWDVVEVSWSDNLVRNLTNGQALPFEPLARSAIELLEAGGLVPYLQASQRSPQNA